jgi:hypothetical protein
MSEEQSRRIKRGNEAAGGKNAIAARLRACSANRRVYKYKRNKF